MGPTGEESLDRKAWRALEGGPSDAGVVAALAEQARPMRGTLVVGITGSVAVGKSTFAADVAGPLGADVVSTDGFLLPNAELAARNLTARKGFPDTYDALALRAFLRAVRVGDPAAAAPVYSHRTYDVVPDAEIRVRRDTVVLEGLHLGHRELGVRRLIDLVVHLDASDDDLERWFLERFQQLRVEAMGDPGAFLHPTAAMDEDVVQAMVGDVWRTVNLINIVEHVRPTAAEADVVLRLGPDHAVEEATVRRPG